MGEEMKGGGGDEGWGGGDVVCFPSYSPMYVLVACPVAPQLYTSLGQPSCLL